LIRIKNFILVDRNLFGDNKRNIDMYTSNDEAKCARKVKTALSILEDKEKLYSSTIQAANDYGYPSKL